MYLYPFLVLVSLIGAGYSFWTKQIKTGLGFVVYAAVFAMLMPDWATGAVSSFLGGGALILFVFGTFVIVYKKRPKEIEKTNGEQNQ